MTDRAKKISELTAHSNAPANNLLVIVHQPGLANAETRKITISNFFANVSSNVSITGKVTVGSVEVINSTGHWVGPSQTLSGAQGAQGTAGPQGVAGAAGAQGAVGAAGTNGAQGAAGANGPAGPTGATGAQGTSAYAFSRAANPGNKLIVSANGTAGFLMSSYVGNNPTVFTLNGTTIAFDLTVLGDGQPFKILNSSNSEVTTDITHISNTGVFTTGAGAQAQTAGIVFWQIPVTVSGTYRYASANTSALSGNLVIKDITALS
jgi:hypothetical protein